MTFEEAKAVAQIAADLFPGVKLEQAKLLSGMVRSFDFKLTSDVVRDHATKVRFLDIPKLKEALRAAENRFRTATSIRNRERKVDWIRGKNSARFGRMAPVEIVRTHYEDCWRAVKQADASEEGIASMRRMIHSHCKAAAYETGLDEEDALALADVVVERQAGESLGSPAGIMKAMDGGADVEAEADRQRRLLAALK